MTTRPNAAHQAGTLSIKQLDKTNWREIDPTWEGFMLISDERDNSTAWVSLVLAYELDPKVPVHLRDLFAVACGILVYSRFYYPLLTVGEEQLYRVLEAAVTEKCKALRVEADSFAQRLKRLQDNGLISSADAFRWKSIRQLRNEASHLHTQSIYPPNQALTMRDTAAELINSLYC